MTVTLEKALRQTAQKLENAGSDTAMLDATLLLCEATGRERLELMIYNTAKITKEQEKSLNSLTKRREKREPMAYILGSKEFWGYDFKVTSDVLIPRPDTETLVATLLTILPDKNVMTSIADIGVGSGCILLTLLKECPHLKGFGVDISDKALKITQKNAEQLQVADRVTLLKGFCADPLPEKMNIIVSNPPYVKRGDIAGLEPELHQEPINALDGGDDGLDVYRALIPSAYKKLDKGGLLLLEIGHDQKDALFEFLASNNWLNVQCFKDLAGRNRVIAAIRA